MSEQILSRTRLLIIIHSSLVRRRARTGMADDQKLTTCARISDVELVRDPKSRTFPHFPFTIRRARSAPGATGHGRELTELFISENNKVRQQESEGTTVSSNSNWRMPAKASPNRRPRFGSLKASMRELYHAAGKQSCRFLSGLQSQLQSEEDALNTAKQQRVYLQTLLSQQRDILSKVRDRQADGDASSRPNEIWQRWKINWKSCRAQLADLSSRIYRQLSRCAK